MMNRFFKKAAIVFAAATMAITGASMAVSANDGIGIDTMDVSVNDASGTRYVKPSVGANVREKPSTDGRILKSLSYNEAVQITGVTTNGWYRFTTTDPLYGGECSGYIYGDLLSTEKGTTQTTTTSYSGKTDAYGFKASANTPSKEYYTVKVDSGYLALRSQASSDPSNEFAKLYNGTQVKVKTSYGQFWCVYVPSTGLVGYVNSNYLV